MISYIGQVKRELANKEIRQRLNKQKSIFVLLVLIIPLIYLIFDWGIVKSVKIAELISGDKMATCRLEHPDGSSGTAFLVSKNGILLTARHCVDELEKNELVTLKFDKIRDKGYDNLKAKVIYFPEDPLDDYAILQLTTIVDIEPLSIAGVIENPDLYNPEVIIIGYPQGSQTQVTDQVNTVRNYTIDYDPTLFEINEIYPGNSGGPVIDKESGEVIGIVSKKWDPKSIDQLQRLGGLSFCEKIQQVFSDPNTSHIDWE